jgi:hypothetical protein
VRATARFAAVAELKSASGTCPTRTALDEPPALDDT